MSRSQRLAKEGLVEVYIGSLEKAKVISGECLKGLYYISSDFECRYDGSDVVANVYENEEGELLAVINR